MNELDVIDVLSELNRELESNPLLEYVTILTIVNNKIRREKRRASETNKLSDELIDKLVSLYNNITKYLSGNESIIKLMTSNDMEPVYKQCKITKIDDLNDKVNFIKNNKKSVTVNEINNTYDCMEKTFSALQELVKRHAEKPKDSTVDVPEGKKNADEANKKKTEADVLAKDVKDLTDKIENIKKGTDENKRSATLALQRVKDGGLDIHERVKAMKEAYGPYEILLQREDDANKLLVSLKTKQTETVVIATEARNFAGKAQSANPGSTDATNADASAISAEQQVTVVNNLLASATTLITEITDNLSNTKKLADEANKVITDFYDALGINADYAQLMSLSFNVTQLIDRLNRNVEILGNREIKLIKELIQGLFEYLRVNHKFKYNGAGGLLAGTFGYGSIGADTDFTSKELEDYITNSEKPIRRDNNKKLKILSLYMQVLIKISTYIYVHENPTAPKPDENTNIFGNLTKDFEKNTMTVGDNTILYEGKKYANAIKKGSGASLNIEDNSGTFMLMGGNSMYYAKYMKYKAKYMKLKSKSD